MQASRTTWAVLPVKETGAAKQRLAGMLTREQRQLLAQAMFEDVLCALARTAGLAGILVITDDQAVGEIAARHGAQVRDEAAREGHTRAVCAAAARLGSSGFDMVTLPADIPLVQPQDLHRLLSIHQPARRAARGFTIVPARDGRGSNAVLCSPADAVPLRFGEDSFLPHLAAAKARGIEPAVLHLARIALDIDTPDDLTLLLRKRARTRAQALLARWGGSLPTDF